MTMKEISMFLVFFFEGPNAPEIEKTFIKLRFFKYLVLNADHIIVGDFLYIG